MESQLSAQLAKAISLSSTEWKPNEIVAGKVTYSGIAVEALKTDNPLQLLNPAAPPEYGSPEDNLLQAQPSGSGSAWKIFSIGF